MKPHAAASNSQLHLRAYYINLDVSGDRRAHIEDQISRVGLEGVRINAIDGREVALFDPRIDPYSFHLCHHALLRPGEVGCYLSHIKALETFLESGDDFALILEDDAVLHCELPSVLRHLSDKRYEWDIAKLYATHVSGIVSQSQLGSSHKLITTCFKHSSSAAYVVDREAAKRLVHCLVPMRLPYDHEFDRDWKTGLRTRIVKPFPASRKRFASTIESATSQKAKSHWKAWHQQGGMLAFRLASELRRVSHELRRAPFTS